MNNRRSGWRDYKHCALIALILLAAISSATMIVSVPGDRRADASTDRFNGSDAYSKSAGPLLREEEVTFRNGDATLAGTLIEPATRGPHPAIVLLGGSNWTTRDVIRSAVDLFDSSGLAVLIYDKRSFGASTGEWPAPFLDQASDAVAAIHYLQSREEINPRQVGLWGSSNGGWLAPLAASLSRDVAFLVLFSAPALSPSRQELERTEHEMRADQFPENEIRQAVEFMRLKFEYARSGQGWDQYSAAYQAAKDKDWFGVYANGPPQIDSPRWRGLRLNQDYDPVPALEKVTCPVIAFWGELDQIVLVKSSKPKMKKALKRAGNRDFKLITVPRANHGLRLAVTGGRKDPPGPAAPGVHETMIEWLSKRVDLQN